jgi:hypothetical protein
MHSMTQADTNISITSRRRFLSHVASVAAGGTAIAVATRAAASPADDSALVKLEEQIFQHKEAIDKDGTGGRTAGRYLV